MKQQDSGGGKGASAPARPGASAAYEAKHLEVLKAAASLFARRGFHDTSLRELARATGRSLSGLYHYFSGKDELLYQIQHHCYTNLLANVRASLAGARSPQEKVVFFIVNHISYFRHHMDEMKVLAHEDVTLTGKPGKEILGLKRDYSELLIQIVAEYGESTPARPSAESAAFVLFGMMNWLYTWPKSVRNLPADVLAESVAQIFLCGFPGCPDSTLASVRESLLRAPQSTAWEGSRNGG
jgi:AcrR family transcriptional regulator